MHNKSKKSESVLVVLSSEQRGTQIISAEQWDRIQKSLAEINRENAKVSDTIKVKSDQAALRTFFP